MGFSKDYTKVLFNSLMNLDDSTWGKGVRDLLGD